MEYYCFYYLVVNKKTGHVRIFGESRTIIHFKLQWIDLEINFVNILSVISEALNIANQLCQNGYFFPISDPKNLVVKDDSSLYRFQVSTNLTDFPLKKQCLILFLLPIKQKIFVSEPILLAVGT